MCLWGAWSGMGADCGIPWNLWAFHQQASATSAGWLTYHVYTYIIYSIYIYTQYMYIIYNIYIYIYTCIYIYTYEISHDISDVLWIIWHDHTCCMIIIFWCILIYFVYCSIIMTTSQRGIYHNSYTISSEYICVSSASFLSSQVWLCRSEMNPATTARATLALASLDQSKIPKHVKRSFLPSWRTDVWQWWPSSECYWGWCFESCLNDIDWINDCLVSLCLLWLCSDVTDLFWP